MPRRCQHALRSPGLTCRSSASSSCPSSRRRAASSSRAPSNVARSSSTSSTSPAFCTSPPSSIRWRVRARRSCTHWWVSSRLRARSSLLRSTVSRRSRAAVARSSANSIAGCCLGPAPAALLTEGLLVPGPPRDRLGASSIARGRRAARRRAPRRAGRRRR